TTTFVVVGASQERESGLGESFMWQSFGRQQVHFGVVDLGAAVDDAVKEAGISRLLRINGIGDPSADSLVDALAKDFVVAHIDEVRQHVPLALAEQAVELASRSQVDGVLAVGGGSTIGLAKIVALETGIPIVAVPTTYAGSEATPVWGRTEGGVKTTGVASQVLPQVVLYAPALTSTLPPSLTIASAGNSLAHCVEALWAPGANPITTVIALEGVGVLSLGLDGFMSVPDALQGRALLQRGAYLGGSAFAVAGSGLHHKLCHVLGGRFDLPHAETHTILLPYVLAFNLGADLDVYARLSSAFGADDPLEGLMSLYGRVGMPSRLSDIGLREEDLAVAVDAASARLPIGNPVPVDIVALTRILRAAIHGDDPRELRG
ncbi:MAG: maleylacetate reductase, partial [Acidimicrobiales bacterium]